MGDHFLASYCRWLIDGESWVFSEIKKSKVKINIHHCISPGVLRIVNWPNIFILHVTSVFVLYQWKIPIWYRKWPLLQRMLFTVYFRSEDWNRCVTLLRLMSGTDLKFSKNRLDWFGYSLARFALLDTVKVTVLSIYRALSGYWIFGISLITILKRVGKREPLVIGFRWVSLPRIWNRK